MTRVLSFRHFGVLQGTVLGCPCNVQDQTGQMDYTELSRLLKSELLGSATLTYTHGSSDPAEGELPPSEPTAGNS